MQSAIIDASNETRDKGRQCLIVFSRIFPNEVNGFIKQFDVLTQQKLRKGLVASNDVPSHPIELRSNSANQNRQKTYQEDHRQRIMAALRNQPDTTQRKPEPVRQARNDVAKNLGNYEQQYSAESISHKDQDQQSLGGQQSSDHKLHRGIVRVKEEEGVQSPNKKFSQNLDRVMLDDHPNTNNGNIDGRNFIHKRAISQMDSTTHQKQQLSRNLIKSNSTNVNQTPAQRRSTYFINQNQPLGRIGSKTQVFKSGVTQNKSPSDFKSSKKGSKMEFSGYNMTKNGNKSDYVRPVSNVHRMPLDTGLVQEKLGEEDIEESEGEQENQNKPLSPLGQSLLSHSRALQQQHKQGLLSQEELAQLHLQIYNKRGGDILKYINPNIPAEKGTQPPQTYKKHRQPLPAIKHGAGNQQLLDSEPHSTNGSLNYDKFDASFEQSPMSNQRKLEQIVKNLPSSIKMWSQKVQFMQIVRDLAQRQDDQNPQKQNKMRKAVENNGEHIAHVILDLIDDPHIKVCASTLDTLIVILQNKFQILDLYSQRILLSLFLRANDQKDGIKSRAQKALNECRKVFDPNSATLAMANGLRQLKTPKSKGYIIEYFKAFYFDFLLNNEITKENAMNYVQQVLVLCTDKDLVLRTTANTLIENIWEKYSIGLTIIYEALQDLKSQRQVKEIMSNLGSQYPELKLQLANYKVQFQEGSISNNQSMYSNSVRGDEQSVQSEVQRDMEVEKYRSIESTPKAQGIRGNQQFEQAGQIDTQYHSQVSTPKASAVDVLQNGYSNGVIQEVQNQGIQNNGKQYSQTQSRKEAGLQNFIQSQSQKEVQQQESNIRDYQKMILKPLQAINSNSNQADQHLKTYKNILSKMPVEAFHDGVLEQVLSTLLEFIKNEKQMYSEIRQVNALDCLSDLLTSHGQKILNEKAFLITYKTLYVVCTQSSSNTPILQTYSENVFLKLLGSYSQEKNLQILIQTYETQCKRQLQEPVTNGNTSVSSYQAALRQQAVIINGLDITIRSLDKGIIAQYVTHFLTILYSGMQSAEGSIRMKSYKLVAHVWDLLGTNFDGFVSNYSILEKTLLSAIREQGKKQYYNNLSNWTPGEVTQMQLNSITTDL